MVVLYILGGLAILLAVALLLPISVSLDFSQELAYKIKLAFFKVYPQKEKPKEKHGIPTTEEKPKDKGFFEKIKEKKGFVGAIKEVFFFFKGCLPPFKLFLKFVKFQRVKVDITVASEDAAKTAIDYGIVCSAVYPVLSFLDGIANVDYKKIDVRTDFESKKSSFNFSLTIKTRVIFILIFVFRIFKEYKKFSIRNDLQ